MYPIAARWLVRLSLATALVAATMVTVTTGEASATTPCTRTYSKVAGNPIQDNAVTSSVIDVPEDDLVVTDVDVTLNLRHTHDGDLSIIVQSETDGSIPRGGATLSDLNGGAGADFAGTVWDDAATTITPNGVAPFTGRFLPRTPLRTLNDFRGGQYRLTVWDQAVEDVGTLDQWSVTLTYATCDVDGDGLDVPTDLCPRLPAATSTGCPVAPRALGAKYRAGKFRGALTSPVAGCRAGRSVSVFRVRSGPDRKIGTASTRADGSWRLARPKKRGRYYATSARNVVSGVAECRAVQSATFRIR